MSGRPERRTPSDIPTPLTRPDLGLLAGAAVATGIMGLPRPVRELLGPVRSPPPPSPGPAFAAPPSGSDALPLLDAEWRLVHGGRYLTLFEFRRQLREGPMPFHWMGSQAGAGLFSPGPGLSPGEALLTPTDRLRSASTLCPRDGGTLLYEPREDRWSCPRCGSRFAGRDGRVLEGPAEKPLVTFFLHRPEDPEHVVLRPPGSR
jgi:ribosomal protein S27AE